MANLIIKHEGEEYKIGGASGWNDIEEPQFCNKLFECTLEEPTKVIEVTGLTGKEKMLFVDIFIPKTEATDSRYLWFAPKNTGGNAFTQNIVLSNTYDNYITMLFLKINDSDDLYQMFITKTTNILGGLINNTTNSQDKQLLALARANADKPSPDLCTMTNFFIGTYHSEGFGKDSYFKVYGE